MALATELAYFETRKTELLSICPGSFALVYGQKLLGIYTKFEEAFEAGVERVGNQPMLIKQIAEHEEVVYFPALEAGLINAHL